VDDERETTTVPETTPDTVPTDVDGSA